MAATFKFYKIGEANAEIEKLSTERDALKARAEAAEQNATDIAEQAEKARKESEGSPNVQKLLDDEKTTHAATRASLEKANTDLKAAQTELAAIPAKIELEASNKAKTILASVGHVALPAALSANPAAQKTEISNLKGLAKVEAAFRAETAAKANLNAK